MRASRISLAVTLCGGPAMGLSPDVFAEVAGGDPLEEITVTARLRAERAADVPASLQVFTAADIKSIGIHRPQDFIALTPSVSVVTTSQVEDIQVNIRGINAARDTEAAFALIIDGVLLTNPAAIHQELPDIEQIEVLKGPQSALYGRNAEAGAIIITTRKPTQEFSADVKAGAGNNELFTASGYVGGGVAEDLAVRAGAYRRETDGFFENRYLGADVVDDYEETGGHARAIWEIRPGATLDVRGKYSEVSGGAVGFTAAFELPDLVGGLGPLAFEDVNEHRFDYFSNVRPEFEQENVNLSVKGDVELGFATLTAIAAWNDQDNQLVADGTSAGLGIYATEPTCQATFAARKADTPLPPPAFYGDDLAGSVLPPFSPTTCDGFQFQIRDQQDASIELRLTSPDNQRLRWIGGLYYLDIDRHVVVEQGADLNQGITESAYDPPSSISPTDLLYDDDFSSHVAAAFGNVAWDPREDLELALALRYDHEERRVDNNVPRALAPFLQPAACQPDCFINPTYNADPTLSRIPSRSKSFSEWQPKVSLSWDVRANLMAYASYGIGFRSGGFNSQGSAATIQAYYRDPLDLQVFNVRDDFDEEVARAAELGFKLSAPGWHLAWDAAVYHTDIDDMQFFEFFAGPFGLLRVVTNVDEVSINGAETSVTWQATDALSLYLGASVTDGRIDQNRNRPYTVGNELPFAPEYLGNFGMQLRLPVSATGMELTGRVDVIAIGETWFHTVQDNRLPTLNGLDGDYSRTERDAYALLNARLALQRGRWKAALWGKNLTDEKYLQEVITAPEFGGAFVHDSARRSYGLEVTWSFGS